MVFPFSFIDLTHALTPDIPAWDEHEHFHLHTTLDYSDCTTDSQFRVQHISTPAGIGTHMDAPSHCSPGGTTIEQLPLEQLIAPCVVIDVSDRAHETYVVSIHDIEQFEQQHGRAFSPEGATDGEAIAPGCFVIIRTGWDTRWHNATAYRNHLQFPTISLAAAQLLLDRKIVGLGIDTLSPDSAPQMGATSDTAQPNSAPTQTSNSPHFPVHQLLLSNGKYIVENVANTDKLPATGSWCLIAPLKIAGGTEAPVRLMGMVKKAASTL